MPRHSESEASTTNFEATRRPILSLVVDRSCCAIDLFEAVEAAVRGGVDWVQIRERGLETNELLAFADAIGAAARRGGPACIIVNRRVDVALAVGAEGVHLGFDGPPLDVARRLLGDAAWIGVSAHDPSEIKIAAERGARYAHLAPIFAPISKTSERPALGLPPLTSASHHGIPVLAQGGVAPEHCAGLVAAGAAGIATTGAILMADDPGGVAARFRAALDGAVL